MTEKEKMKLTYIFHSGFVLETEHTILVFDYWLDPSGVMEDVLRKQKPIYVFSSHFHEDHFTRDIFDWKRQKSDITYILSKDILKHRRANKDDADVWLAKGGSWSDEIDPIAHEKQYLGELKDIRKIADGFDLVMFPIDGRIGNGYTLGGRQFIERFKVGMFVPMHFVASGFESSWRMKEFTDEKQIPFWEIKREGETILL